MPTKAQLAAPIIASAVTVTEMGPLAGAIPTYRYLVVHNPDGVDTSAEVDIQVHREGQVDEYAVIVRDTRRVADADNAFRIAAQAWVDANKPSGMVVAQVIEANAAFKFAIVRTFTVAGAPPIATQANYFLWKNGGGTTSFAKLI